jgi:hypothetical protein
MDVRIKENSWLAKMAAKRLKVSRVAMVIGRNIHLYNTTKSEFLKNRNWLRHEAVHVKQYMQHGFIKFLALYLLESFKKGYYNNRFEAEARAKETDENILSGLNFI